MEVLFYNYIVDLEEHRVVGHGDFSRNWCHYSNLNGFFIRLSLARYGSLPLMDYFASDINSRDFRFWDYDRLLHYLDRNRVMAGLIILVLFLC